jgi:hypothetical protein
MSETERGEQRTMEWAMRVSKELSEGFDTAAEERLRAKCAWERMSRTAVILEWGDPRMWE